MKTIWQVLIRAALGTIGVVLAFMLMLYFNTAPATAFAYLLFFTTLRWISVVTIKHDAAIDFAVASLLCMAASLWILRSNAPVVWERQDDDIYSIAWRSGVILFCILGVPRCASQLALRSIRPRRLPFA